MIAGDDDEMFMTRNLNVTSEITEQHLIARSDKSVACVTNNKRLRSTFCTIEADYWQTRSIARPLCDSWATCYFLLSRSLNLVIHDNSNRHPAEYRTVSLRGPHTATSLSHRGGDVTEMRAVMLTTRRVGGAATRTCRRRLTGTESESDSLECRCMSWHHRRLSTDSPTARYDRHFTSAQQYLKSVVENEMERFNAL